MEQIRFKAVAEPLPVDAATLIKQLRALGQAEAERLDMAPELMLRKKTLEALVKSGYPEGPYQLPDSLRGCSPAVARLSSSAWPINSRRQPRSESGNW